MTVMLNDVKLELQNDKDYCLVTDNNKVYVYEFQPGADMTNVDTEPFRAYVVTK